MKVLVIEPGPAFSVDDVRRGLVGGLEGHGCTVGSFNMGDRVGVYAEAQATRDGELRNLFDFESACRLAAQGVKAACWDFLPDVVIVVSSFYVPPELYINLRERKRHVVLWLTESPYQDDIQLQQAPYADTVIINDPVNLEAFRRQNPRTWYVPHAYDPAVHHNVGRTDGRPFAFVGTGYPSRIELLEKVDWPCTPTIAGNWQSLEPGSPLLPYLLNKPEECLDNTDTADLYRDAVTSANIYRKEAHADDLVDGWAMGPREVELAACGTWFAREARGEGDELFPMLPTFTEAGELAEQVGWALDNPDARQAAIDAARAAIADRTFANNAQQLLNLIGA